MQTHHEVWEHLKKHKIVRVEFNVSSTLSLQKKSLLSFRRILSKHKNLDVAYKRRQPRATLSSQVIQVVEHKQGFSIALLEFKLNEIPQAGEI